MAKFCIEVEKILEGGECPFGYQVGDRFEYDVSDRMVTFPDFCGWAYREMFPILIALRFGADLPFYQDPKTARITCSDAKNPVVFRISFED